VNRAKEFLMTGDLIPAREAERIGLVNHVLPLEDLIPAARELAERLANGPTWAVRRTKALINKLVRERIEKVLDISLTLEALSSLTQDHWEGVQAFLEKRPPRFTGT
jgi:enoyl-CoA hydratase/carnithine racemase